MRDVYIWFSLIYFLAGGFHLWQQHKMIQELREIKQIVVYGVIKNG